LSSATFERSVLSMEKSRKRIIIDFHFFYQCNNLANMLLLFCGFATAAMAEVPATHFSFFRKKPEPLATSAQIALY
jgi:hypothetical protein